MFKKTCNVLLKSFAECSVFNVKLNLKVDLFLGFYKSQHWRGNSDVKTVAHILELNKLFEKRCKPAQLTGHHQTEDFS